MHNNNWWQSALICAAIVIGALIIAERYGWIEPKAQSQAQWRQPQTFGGIVPTPGFAPAVYNQPQVIAAGCKSKDQMVREGKIPPHARLVQVPGKPCGRWVW